MTGDPTRGAPASIRATSRQHEARAQVLRDEQTRLERTAGGLSAGEWSGSAKRRFTSAAETLGPSYSRTASLIEHVAQTLSRYADEVERIQDEAARIRSAQDSAASDRERLVTNRSRLNESVDAGTDVESDHVMLRRVSHALTQQDDEDAQLSTRWDELVAERTRLDDRTAAELSGIESVGIVAAQAHSVGRMSDLQVLSWLSSLKPDQLLALRDDPAIADRLASVSDPEMIADWWSSAGGAHERGSSDEHSPEQDALIAAFPAVIGNLNGVAYWARDRANRSNLKTLIKSASGEDLAAYKNIRASLGKYKGVQLTSLVPQHPPLAAVSIGDLDTAHDVTYLVPGMDSDTRNMTVVERAAYNLRVRQQDYVKDAAVVAWINYETPTTKTVLHGDLARAGSERLGQDLAGFNAARGSTKGTLNVVGHSYGSTTSSLTLADRDYGVNAYVTAGSAGLEREIKTADDIHSDQVFAAQAPRSIPGLPGDNWSWIGQAFSMTRRDPAIPSFGATYLPTAGLPHDPMMNGVNRHDPIWNNATDHAGQYGYFDKNTESLDNIARATTGKVSDR
jgi:uncharacterized protein YukE